jgi:peroxiredoxin
MKTYLTSVILIAALFSIVSGQVQRQSLKVGDKAPDFSLPNPDGKSVMLTDYTSRGPVVVIFYRGYW